LTNVVRHAQARNVSVALEHNDAASRLTLTVRDDGCGIYPGKLAGFGMRGMRERVEGLAGCCAIDSQAGAGTCVRVMLPLSEAGYVTAKSAHPAW
jgi:signal transduction histidine kinase